MVQSRMRTSAILIFWAALLGGTFGLVQQRVWALPACVTCNCKAVIRWWFPGEPNPAVGSKQPGTANDMLTALVNITTSGGCQAGNLVANGNYDLWVFTTGNVVCAPAPGNVLQELTTTDTGTASSYGNQANKCQTGG